MTEYEQFAVWCWFVCLVGGGDWKVNEKGTLQLTFGRDVLRFPLHLKG